MLNRYLCGTRHLSVKQKLPLQLEFKPPQRIYLGCYKIKETRDQSPFIQHRESYVRGTR